jgi:40-residue YVTN family beta-propeller repeat
MPDGEKMYVATGRGNSVSTIDARTLEILKTIPVGQRVWGIGLTRDARKLYAANGLSNDVSVIDTETDKVIKTIKAGDGPWGVSTR